MTRKSQIGSLQSSRFLDSIVVDRSIVVVAVFLDNVMNIVEEAGTSAGIHVGFDDVVVEVWKIAEVAVMPLIRNTVSCGIEHHHLLYSASLPGEIVSPKSELSHVRLCRNCEVCKSESCHSCVVLERSKFTLCNFNESKVRIVGFCAS